jgi:hypothetical protein
MASLYGVSVHKVACFLIRTVECGRSKQSVFGVDYAKLGRTYQGDYSSPDNIIAWLKGGKPATSGTSGSGKTAGASMKLTEADKRELRGRIKREIIDDSSLDKTNPRAVKQAVAVIIERLTGSGKPKDLAKAKLALTLIPKMLRNNGDSEVAKTVEDFLKTDTRTYTQFATGFKTAGMYKTAFVYAQKSGGNAQKLYGEILQECIGNFNPKKIGFYLQVIAKMSTKDAKAKQHALLAARALKSNEQPVREKALFILSKIKTVDGKRVDLTYRFDTTKDREVLADYQGLGIDVGEKGITLGILISKIRIALKATTQLLLAEKNIKIHRDPRALGNAIELRQGLSIKEAIREVARLDAIIKKSTNNPYHQARALYIKGMLLYAIAKKFPKSKEFTFKVKGIDVTITGKVVFQEAMYALRKAWEISMKTKNIDPHHIDLLTKTFTRMAKICDGFYNIKIASRSQKNKRKRFARLLARFIPKSKRRILFLAFSTKSQARPMNPIGYREYIDAGSDDEYEAYKSKLTLGPKQTAPANPGKSRSSGKTHVVRKPKVTKRTPESGLLKLKP